MKQSFYYNGTILTMEGDTPRYVESVLVEDGVILAAGEKSTLSRDVGAEAKKVNLKGKTMLPAFIDAHACLMREAYGSMRRGGKKSIWRAFPFLLREAARYAGAGFTLVHAGRVTWREYLMLRLAGVCGLLPVDVVCQRETGRRGNAFYARLRKDAKPYQEERTARIRAWNAGLALYRCGVENIGAVGISEGKTAASPYELLREVTIDAAYLLFEEEERGSIRAGKDADFVILDRNPMELEPARFRSIRILETIRRGRRTAGKRNEKGRISALKSEVSEPGIF